MSDGFVFSSDALSMDVKNGYAVFVLLFVFAAVGISLSSTVFYLIQVRMLKYNNSQRVFAAGYLTNPRQDAIKSVDVYENVNIESSSDVINERLANMLALILTYPDDFPYDRTLSAGSLQEALSWNDTRNTITGLQFIGVGATNAVIGLQITGNLMEEENPDKSI